MRTASFIMRALSVAACAVALAAAEQRLATFPDMALASRADWSVLEHAFRSNSTVFAYGSTILLPGTSESERTPLQWLIYEAERFVQHHHALATRPSLRLAGSEGGDHGASADRVPACAAVHYSEDRSSRSPLVFNVPVDAPAAAATGADGAAAADAGGLDQQLAEAQQAQAPTTEPRAVYPHFGSLCFLELQGVHGLPYLTADGSAPRTGRSESWMGQSPGQGGQDSSTTASDSDSQGTAAVTHRLLMSIGSHHGDVSVYSYTYGCGHDGLQACEARAQRVTGGQTATDAAVANGGADATSSEAVNGSTAVAVTVDGQTEPLVGDVEAAGTAGANGTATAATTSSGNATNAQSAATAADAAPAADPLPATLRLLSFNVWNVNPPTWLWRDPRDRLRQYSFRLMAIADVLAQASADIIAFQEVRYDSTLGGWDEDAHTPAWRSNGAFKAVNPPVPAAEAGSAASGANGASGGSSTTAAALSPLLFEAPLDATRSAALDAIDASEDHPGTGVYGALTKPARGQPFNFAFGHNVAQFWYNWTNEFTSTPRFLDRGRGKWEAVMAAEGWANYSAGHPTEGRMCPSAAALAAAGGQAKATPDSLSAALAAAGVDARARPIGCNPWAAEGLSVRANPPRARYQRAIRRHPHAQVMHLASLVPPGWHFVHQPASLYLDRDAWVQSASKEGRLVQEAPTAAGATPTAAGAGPRLHSAGSNKPRDEEGPAIFSRWPIIASHALLLSRNTSDEGDSHQRLCLHATIRVPAVSAAALRGLELAQAGSAATVGDDAAASEGRTATAAQDLILDVYTVHLSLSEAARNRSVGEILRFIGETAHAKGAAVVLTGDMNAEPHEPALRALTVGMEGLNRPVVVAEGGAGSALGAADALTLPDGRPVGLLQDEAGPGQGSNSKHGSWMPVLRDAWLEAGNSEPAPRSPDAAVKRYGLTFPSDNPTKRIDLVLVGAGRGAAAGGNGATAGEPAGQAVSGSSNGGARVLSSWLLGQDALPGTDAYEGRGTGMVGEQSPVWPSDHRAVAAELQPGQTGHDGQ